MHARMHTHTHIAHRHTHTEADTDKKTGYVVLHFNTPSAIQGAKTEKEMETARDRGNN